jgi:hypothetical protein
MPNRVSHLVQAIVNKVHYAYVTGAIAIPVPYPLVDFVESLKEFKTDGFEIS